MVGKSSWSSVAPSERKSSKTSSSTSWGRASLRSILLITTIGLRLQVQRLLEHELRAGQRPLGGVDEQQHAIDHRQGALDLAAEVGVAGRVDDVDLGALVEDRRVLGEDRDAALALQVVRVHDARRPRCWFWRKTPVWLSMWSTSVVLPWSTWAMMAMLRMSSRRCMRVLIGGVSPRVVRLGANFLVLAGRATVVRGAEPPTFALT